MRVATEDLIEGLSDQDTPQLCELTSMVHVHIAFRGDTMAAIEKAINDFFNSGSLKAAAYRANAIFGFSSKVRRSYVK